MPYTSYISIYTNKYTPSVMLLIVKKIDEWSTKSDVNIKTGIMARL